ncbi:MAG TPA: HAMP domain-containing sensor histidine kinase, partial [Anaerolineales bacterium]|nr:HAMP domain-containing sensor histidine kinase [Anaerolineales bacterium]
DVLHFYAAAAQQKSIPLKVERLDAGDIWADPVRLRQIIENLVSNAIKYSPPGSQVKLSAALEGEYWRISVVDHGPGIAPGERARLFQPFARLSALPTGGEKSTGLGLAITHTYVQAHGGQIGVESEPGRGSTFWFTVPLPAEAGRIEERNP